MENHNKKMSEEEKQVMLLQRRYSVMDSWRNYMMQIPSLFCLAMFGFTTFILKDLKESSPELIYFGISVILILLLSGLFIQYHLHRHYNILRDEIFYLYEKLGMIGYQYFIDFKKVKKNNQRTSVNQVFNLGYASILMTAITCCVFFLINLK